MDKKKFTIITNREVAEAAQSLHRSMSGIDRKSFTFVELSHNDGYTDIILEADLSCEQKDFFNDLFFFGMNVQREIDWKERDGRTKSSLADYRKTLDGIKGH